MQNDKTTKTYYEEHAEDVATHLERITHEFRSGFEFISKYPKSVTVFGSSRTIISAPMYAQAVELCNRIVTDLKYAIITGGGGGIMEAANKGASEAGGPSVGLNISLPHERLINTFAGDNMKFSYFFSRKAMLTFAAEAYVFFPGGFGTFDELFGVLTLIQTGKIPHVPVILFGSEFWNPLKKFLHSSMVKDFQTIEEKDLNLFTITDSHDEAIHAIGSAPVSEWWKKIN